MLNIQQNRKSLKLAKDAGFDHPVMDRLSEALDEIEILRTALKPFADCADQISPDEDDEEWAKFRLIVGEYRAAKAALMD